MILYVNRVSAAFACHCVRKNACPPGIYGIIYLPRPPTHTRIPRAGAPPAPGLPVSCVLHNGHTRPAGLRFSLCPKLRPPPPPPRRAAAGLRGSGGGAGVRPRGATAVRDVGLSLRR